MHLNFCYGLTEKARDIAIVWHHGQKRKDGVTEYFNHPEVVVQLLISWGIEDEVILAAAYCHDLLEDTEVSVAQLETELGERVVSTVQSLTKAPDVDKQEYLDSIAEDANISVLLIKTADRICNTHDFISDNNIAKAYSYFHSADSVYKAIQEYSSSIDNVVYESLMKSLITLDCQL